MYVAGHGLVKGALFLCVGILLHRFDSVDEPQLHGAARRMTGLAVIFFAAAFGLVGAPLFATAMGKAMMEADAAEPYKLWLTGAALITSVLTGGAVLRAADVPVIVPRTCLDLRQAGKRLSERDCFRQGLTPGNGAVMSRSNQASLSSLIERDLRQVRTALREVAQDFRESTRLLMERAAVDRGKLLRPALLLLSGGALGAVTPDHIRAATVLELIHNATLLHDDVLDGGDLRRGQPTANRRWGNPAAVRLGDALLSRVLGLSMGLPPYVRAAFGRVIRRTCDGEIRQTLNAGNLSLTEREYLAIVGCKTAALFEGACYLGARLAGAAARQCRAVARFGYSTGMAYQIMDDLLDLIGDSRALRKTLGTDLRRVKLTLPLVHSLRVAGEPAWASLLPKLAAGSLRRCELLPVLAAGGSVDYVLARVRRYQRRAAEALHDVPSTPRTNALREVSDSILREAVGGSTGPRDSPQPRRPVNPIRYSS